jgi:hypothetical protein
MHTDPESSRLEKNTEFHFRFLYTILSGTNARMTTNKKLKCSIVKPQKVSGKECAVQNY